MQLTFINILLEKKLELHYKPVDDSHTIGIHIRLPSVEPRKLLHNSQSKEPRVSQMLMTKVDFHCQPAETSLDHQIFYFVLPILFHIQLITRKVH